MKNILVIGTGRSAISLIKSINTADKKLARNNRYYSWKLQKKLLEIIKIVQLGN